MRLLSKLEVQLGQDNDLVRKALDELLTVDDTLPSTHGIDAPTIAISDTYVVTFDAVLRAKYVLVLALDNLVNVSVNGGTALGLKPLPAAAVGSALSTIQQESRAGVMWLSGCDVTSLSIANPSGTLTAKVIVAVVGEQT